ncbi:MAG: exosortase-associated EpsI family protein [Planctomycetota bacterium]
MHYAKLAKLSRASTRFVWVLAITLVILAGIGYRVLASRLKLVVGTPVRLPIPLSSLPIEIGNWTGKDAPIPLNVQRVAGTDDFSNRLYTNKLNNKWANVYIAYTARPRTMLGHRPQICYPAGGWVHDSTRLSEVVSKMGTKVPCLINRFHMPAPSYEERIVLNFYIVNGQLTSDESVFSGVGWRTPNIAGDPARYAAQVQISSVLENYVRTAATDMTDLILDYFPNQSDKVKAAEFYDAESTVLK